MVSQPTMRRILTPCLLGLLAALVLFASCGQNEGGRCQINSDCASGLKCDSTTGNGKCVSSSAVLPTNDAAPKNDSAPDEPGPSSSDVGFEADPNSDIDAVSVDPGAVDSGSLDATGLD